MKAEILLIDSDPIFSSALVKHLEEAGFILSVVHESKFALLKAQSQTFAAIILNVNLSDCHGLQILKALRQKLTTPVLIIANHKEEVDQVLAFELQANDYLARPFSPQTLIARLRNILQYAHQITAKSVITVGNLTLDCNQHQATLANQELELTNTEFAILELLTKNPTQAFSKEELTEYAIGRKFTAYDRSIDVHISNLRNKLGNTPRGAPWIKTIRGFGYQFNV